MQQRLEKSKVNEIIDANSMKKGIIRIKRSVKFASPKSVCEVKPIRLSDASHGSGSEIYGPNGFLCGMIADEIGGNDHTFHPLSLSSHKLRRVSH